MRKTSDTGVADGKFAAHSGAHKVPYIIRIILPII